MNNWTIYLLSGIILALRHELLEQSMVFTLQSITRAKSVDDTSGYQHPIREIQQRLLAPVGALQKALGRVIFQYTGKFEAPLVIPIYPFKEILFSVRDITKEGFINFISRRHNV